MPKKEFVYVIINNMKRAENGIVAVARSNYQAKQIFKGQEASHIIVRVRLLDLERPKKKQKPKTVF